MNLTVRLGKQFRESSPCLPRQLAAGQVRQWNSHKTVYLTLLSGSFCHLVDEVEGSHRAAVTSGSPLTSCKIHFCVLLLHTE